MDRASVFMNGRSQAVRLPQAYRFEPGTKAVQVRRLGRTVILEPIEKRGWDPHYWESLKAMAPMDETIEPFKIEFNLIKPEDL